MLECRPGKWPKPPSAFRSRGPSRPPGGWPFAPRACRRRATLPGRLRFRADRRHPHRRHAHPVQGYDLGPWDTPRPVRGRDRVLGRRDDRHVRDLGHPRRPERNPALQRGWAVFTPVGGISTGSAGTFELTGGTGRFAQPPASVTSSGSSPVRGRHAEGRWRQLLRFRARTGLWEPRVGNAPSRSSPTRRICRPTRSRWRMRRGRSA
jgi:hypothetical protein